MPNASRIHLSRLQSFLVGAIGGWGLAASIATMAWGRSLWTGWLLAPVIRPDTMQCGELETAERLHRAAAGGPDWAGIAAEPPSASPCRCGLSPWGIASDPRT